MLPDAEAKAVDVTPLIASLAVAVATLATAVMTSAAKSRNWVLIASGIEAVAFQ